MAKRKPSDDQSKTPSKILVKRAKPNVMKPLEDPRVSCLRQIYLSQQYLEKQLPKSYHIEWKGFSSDDGPVGQVCLLCEKDLSIQTTRMGLEVYSNPDAAVLACGHAFHSKCLEVAVSLELEDPECFMCAGSS